MKERILEFLRTENKSSAQFAEEIGVQPSGISHILSGRNNPSLDFVLKMLEKYQFLSVDWLLFGKGDMYRNAPMKTLFDDNYKDNINDSTRLKESKSTSPFVRKDENIKDLDINDGKLDSAHENPVTRIVYFYSDKTFKEFFPAE